MSFKRVVSRAYVGIMLIFLYAPIVVLMIFSFNDSKSRTLWQGFTLDWYVKLFRDGMIMHSVYITLAAAIISSAVSTVLGTAAAVGIAGFGKKARAVIMNVTNIPVLSPEIITGVSLMLLFVWADTQLNRLTGASLSLDFITLLLAHISFEVPYVILCIMPKLRQIDPHIYEAALDLGAKPYKALQKVILPQIRPGVITGLIMAFTLSVDDFVISYFTSGPTSQTLSITIYSMTRKRVSPEINALSTLLFAVVLILLIIINIRNTKDQKSNQKKEVETEDEN